MSLEAQIQKVENAVSVGMHEVYSGLNRPDYDVPPHLGGDSPEQINWLAVLILVAVGASLGLGWILDSRCRGALMEGRPHFWAILLLCTSYLLLIPGLINPVFSFSIVINIIGHRKNVEPEAGHPVCTETTSGLAHLLWKTGSRVGAFLVILFSMVIPAFELVMLVFGEVFRFASARCAEIFRWVILWVQHRSKWASPDMFAYVLLVDLVRTLDQEPLILSRARRDRGRAGTAPLRVNQSTRECQTSLVEVNPQVGDWLLVLQHVCGHGDSFLFGGAVATGLPRQGASLTGFQLLTTRKNQCWEGAIAESQSACTHSSPMLRRNWTRCCRKFALWPQTIGTLLIYLLRPPLRLSSIKY